MFSFGLAELLHWHRQPRSIRARRWRRTPVRCRTGCEAPETFGCWLSSYEKPSAGGRFVVPGSIDRPQELALRLMAASINKGVALVLWKRRITGTKRRAAWSFILLVSYAGIYR